MNDTPDGHADLLAGLVSLAATDDLTVGKDGFNKHFGYGYMTEAALFTAARAVLAEAGLSGTISFEGGQHEIIPTWNKDGQERPGILATVTARLVVRDKQGQQVECTAYGQGLDNADKAYYKAQTGAAKYVVQKALMIAVESDDTDNEQGGSVAGGGGQMTGPASDKQLGYLCSLVKKILRTEHGETEPMALRLARMGGSQADVFAKIDKAAASDLIERLKKVEENPASGTVVLERLAQWEAEHGVPTTPPPPAPPSSDDDVPFQ